MIRIKFDDGTELETEGRVEHHPAVLHPYHTRTAPGVRFERILVFLPAQPPPAMVAKAGTYKEVGLTWPGGGLSMRNVAAGTWATPPMFWIEEVPTP